MLVNFESEQATAAAELHGKLGDKCSQKGINYFDGGAFKNGRTI